MLRRFVIASVLLVAGACAKREAEVPIAAPRSGPPVGPGRTQPAATSAPGPVLPSRPAAPGPTAVSGPQHGPWGSRTVRLAATGQVALLSSFQQSEAGEYWVALDGSVLPIYFEANPASRSFRADVTLPLPDGSRLSAAVERVRPLDGAPHGLRKTVHLARFDVNGGHGTTFGAYFVVTHPEVLDGSPDYPIVPAEALREAVADFAKEVESRGPELTKIAVAALGPTPDGWTQQPVRQGSLVVLPTWLAREEELGAELRQSVEVQRETVSIEVVPCPRCPPGAPCVACGPVTRTSTARALVELSARYRFDKRGQRLERTILPPTVR